MKWDGSGSRTGQAIAGQPEGRTLLKREEDAAVDSSDINAVDY